MPGKSISGYLDGTYWSDYDWHRLEGVSAGTKITVSLSGPSSADFDLCIWKDGDWDECSMEYYTSSEQVETTAGITPGSGSALGVVGDNTI